MFEGHGISGFGFFRLRVFKGEVWLGCYCLSVREFKG